MTSRSDSSAGLPPASDRLDFPLIRLSLVLMFAAIVALLDTTVVNVAIDSLAAEFSVPLSTIQWVSTGYLLAVAVAIPIAGWAIDRFGGRRVWLFATSAFLLGSLLAGLSWNAESLIAFRIFQGLGGGMIEPVVLASVAMAAGPNRIGRMMSIMLIPINLAPVIGPIVGGLIVDEVTWRWIFLVNIPVGIIALLLGLKYIPHDEPASPSSARLDLVGIALLPPGFAAIIFALTASAEHGGFANSTVLTTAAIGIALLAAYVVHALRTRETPLFDVRLFANRRFAISSLVLAIMGAIGFATIFLLPLYYQLVHGVSALRAGVLLAPFGIGMGVGMAVAGVYADRIPARRFGIAGALVTIVSSLLLALVERGVADEWIALFTLRARIRDGARRGTDDGQYLQGCEAGPGGAGDDRDVHRVPVGGLARGGAFGRRAPGAAR